MRILHIIKRVQTLLLFVLFSSVSLFSQNTNIHCVERGETWESIAEKYGVDVNSLKSNNKEIDYLYLGIELAIPSRIVQTPDNSNASMPALPMTLKQTEFSNRLKGAIIHITKDENKEARKILNDLIKKYPEYITSDVYYYRAISSYYCEKYRAAEKDLVLALNDANFQGLRRDEAQQLLERTQQKRAEIHEQNGAIIGGLVAAAAATTAAVMASKQSTSANYSSNKPDFSNMSEADVKAYVNNSLSKMMVDTYQQVQIQMAQKNANVTSGFIQSYRQIHGRNPSQEEIDQHLAMYWQMKNEATSRASSSSSSSSSDSNSSSSSSISKSNNRKMCKICAGLGDCKTCEGKGYFHNPYDWRKTVLCPNCESNHNGKCASCHGTGYQ